jgi:hypothetical protein
MKTFLEFAEPILKEMPYFHYVDDERTPHNFDLEVESRDFDDLSSLIIHALSGGLISGDPAKTTPMQLKTTEEKQQFIDSLMDINGQFMLFAFSKYGSKISPVIRNIKVPVNRRSKEELEAYKNWITKLLKKSQLLSK